MASDSVFGTLYNGDSVSLTRGMIVRIAATRAAVRAQADSTAHLAGMYGIVLSGSVAPGGPVNAAPNATRCPVLLEVGLTLVAGQALYVSETVPGRCTNVAPSGIPFPIGFIENVASYTNDSFVFASVMVSSVSAADFAKLATVPAGEGLVGVLKTDIIDFLAPPANGYAFTGNQRAGFYFVQVAATCTFLAADLDGTVTTGPTTRIYTDTVNRNNLSGAAVMPSTANINAARTSIVGGAPAAKGFYTLAAITPGLFDLPILLDVTVAAVANTATRCRGRIGLVGYWMPST